MILGSATPCVESYFHALQHKYTLISLQHRYNAVPLPQVEMIDLTLNPADFKPSIQMSGAMIRHVADELQAEGMILLFLNRRGTSRVRGCLSCGSIFQCRYCDAPLVFHARQKRMICHYCGYWEPPGNQCPTCGSDKLYVSGAGTQKVEDQSQNILRVFGVLRYDRMPLHWEPPCRSSTQVERTGNTNCGGNTDDYQGP